MIKLANAASAASRCTRQQDLNSELRNPQQYKLQARLGADMLGR